MEWNQQDLEKFISKVVLETLTKGKNIKKSEHPCEQYKERADGIISVKVPQIKVGIEDRMDTGNEKNIVYTKDLFDLEESKRLGCGIMEMKATTFEWTLNYDEVDYIMEGTLSIIKDGKKVSAGPGEVLFIPKGSRIEFCVEQYARFLYVTYPADWANVES